MESFSALPKDFATSKFDYLIVGGGTAGLVVAARLSENPNVVVGVIEAGFSALDEPLVSIPGNFGRTIGTKYDWAFATVPQEGLKGASLPWPRGKMLGGTSGMNFLVWNRGAKEDYDAWEQLGNEGWNWEQLKYYFKKSERMNQPPASFESHHQTFFKPEDHGRSGPVSTAYPSHIAPTHKYWHSTLKNMGINTNKSHFGGSNIGAWTSVACLDPQTQTRSYSASAYYRPNARRENLHVLTEAHVLEIVMSETQRGGDFTATGVKIKYQGSVFTIPCSKEVIVCGGSVGSPQLLELSGVGNPAILKKAGITPRVANINVGENLQEHMMTMTVFEIDTDIVTPDNYADPKFLEEALRLYETQKSGLLTCTPASMAYLPLSKMIPAPEVGQFLRRAEDLASSHPRDSTLHKLDKMLSRQFLPQYSLGQVEYMFDHSNYSPFYVSEPGKKYASMMQILQYPFTRGSIHIDASSPHDKVVIDPKYYQGEGSLDLDIMIKAQAYGDTIWRHEPMRSIIKKRVWPPETLKGQTTDWAAWVPAHTTTDWHPVGTCSMLPRDAGGVVDAKLKVYGTTNVRVVDASVFPLHVSAHIQATIYAVAEKAADMIKETSGQPQLMGKL
ncbi:hypothetical protein A1O1_08022 [Capronia coronata CBS 617.96]|uniref:Glucose-methanol-choline oxidoreductase N-terminal domain-containing protein n=1 Tax=Capronia coronata CBS 617.96 TaxID=1182541 RepID=W9XX74_9EURO|nr:uncharacterized protein A1O1_08022 [Capronia coronata CBS 617.96]EXJ81955.1 hypothetical protein A1O1_08022 [Capronia coronata CBS 617.96]